MSYPEFCCQCCGFVNGDMFYDWLNGREATQEEDFEFRMARKIWQTVINTRREVTEQKEKEQQEVWQSKVRKRRETMKRRKEQE